jgi:hypothetical protein
MRKAISPTAHGVLDYSTVGAALVAPRLLDFSRGPALATYSLAAAYLALSALTDYPPALKRSVPLQVHGASDAALGAVLPLLPWMLGFAREARARNFFLALTGVTIAVTVLTDWQRRERGRSWR